MYTSPLSPRGCAMDDVYEIGLFGLFLIKALMGAVAGGLIMGALDGLSHIFWDGKVTKKQYLWALGASFVLGLFVQWQGTYHEMEQLKKPLQAVTDENSNKTIGDLRQQLNERNIEIQELKRLKDKAEETASRGTSDNAALNKKLREIQGKLADKVSRQTHMEKLAAFLDTGEAIKRKCFSGLDTPRKEAVEWHDEVLNYLKTTMDSSHVMRFKNTRSPNAKLHYFLPDGKPVERKCNENAQDLDIKLEVLRDFLSELSK